MKKQELIRKLQDIELQWSSFKATPMAPVRWQYLETRMGFSSFCSKAATRALFFAVAP